MRAELRLHFDKNARIINSCGGSDEFCAKVLGSIYRDADLIQRLNDGRLSWRELVIPRELIEIAAVNSLMAARLDIERGQNGELSKIRLEQAELTFFVSRLLADDVETPIPTDNQRGQAALKRIGAFEDIQKWLEADTEKFEFRIKI